MAMVCSQCATIHEQCLQCPGCGIRLEYHDIRQRPARVPTRWQYNPPGRILIGLLLSQGLFYGLYNLTTGLLLAFSPSEQSPDETMAFNGLILTQVLQAIALLAGGLLAGSGQQNGALLGAIVGVWNGVLAGLALRSPGLPFSNMVIFGQPLLHTLLGALAGWAGSIFWKPLPSAEPVKQAATNRKTAPRRRMPVFAGPVTWPRVILGTILAVSGTLSATVLFKLLMRFGEDGLIGTGTVFDQLILWEIKALALIAGGALAGFNMHNGPKQGLCVGIATTVILAGVQLRLTDRWLELIAFLLVSSLCLCLVGGWFGSQLLPPLVPYKRRRHLGPASMA